MTTYQLKRLRAILVFQLHSALLQDIIRLVHVVMQFHSTHRRFSAFLCLDFVERRPLKSFMKMYKTPPEKRKKRDDRQLEDEEEKLRCDEDLLDENMQRYNHNNVSSHL